MPGLSADPDAQARQLDALARGRATAAANLLGRQPEARAPSTSTAPQARAHARAQPADVPVLDHPKPKPARKRKPKPKPAPTTEEQHAREDEPRGFWHNFFGG